MPTRSRSILALTLAGAAAGLAACAAGVRSHRMPTPAAPGSGVAYARGAARPPSAPIPVAAPVPVAAPRPAASGGALYAARDATLEQAIEGGRAAGKPVALYFLASWCGFCRKLETNTLSDGAVQQDMSRYYNVRVNPDSAAGRALASRFGISGFPTVVLVDGRGNVVGTLVGYRDPLDMCSRLRAGR